MSFLKFKIDIFLLKIFTRSSKCEDAYIDKILRSDEMFESISVLTSDLLYKIDPGHCYTLITDQLYNDVLQPKLFQEISRSTVFVVRVKFNEDMLSPKNVTKTALQAGKWLIF